MTVSSPYRSDLFLRNELKSLDAVDNALTELTTSLKEKNIQDVVLTAARNETPTTLALILANMPSFLVSALMRAYPKSAAGFPGSVHDCVLHHLSTTFLFLFDDLADRETKITFTRNDLIVRAGSIVLRALSTYTPPKVEDNNMANSPTGRRVKGPSQKKTKQAKRAAAPVIPAVDSKYYDALDVPMPTSPPDVYRIADEISQKLKAVLEFYFGYLQDDKVIAFLKQASVFVPPPQACADSGNNKIKSEAPEKVENQSPVAPGSVYPNVQPMKSALHFDSPEGFGAWKIIVRNSVQNVLRRARKKCPAAFDIIVKKMKELSLGHFSEDNQKRLSGFSSSDVAVFEAKLSRDLRIIYQIDLIPTDNEAEQQAIKIFDICTHTQMDNRLRAAISSQMRKKGALYRDHCAVRMKSTLAGEKDMLVPATFPALPEVSPAEVATLPDVVSNDSTTVLSRVVVEKFVTFSKPFLDGILADVEMTLPHLVSSQEKKIIEHPTSCYVIGRSGTGKTTTMLFKMLLIERTHHLVGDGGSRPRQVFVTKSRHLATKVQEYFEKLSTSLTHASKTLEELRTLSTAPPDDISISLVPQEERERRADLPAKYSELEDKHFPLFITYDALCDLLEADILTKRQDYRIADMISFEKNFESTYWAHFPEHLRKGLDPALVFSEIIGVIKGSEETLTKEKRYLSLQDYEHLSGQRSTLEGRTPDVYGLFESYLKLKMENNGYDCADRTHQILRYLEELGIPGTRIDHLYVDEVQDNLLIDAMILRALCSNPHGLFWAGDTAQAISIGSAFRLDDLKAFLFRIENQNCQNQSQSPNVAVTRVADPELFQLAVNYRSHAGIVDCAHSVIDLITRFWPNSIDRLSPEVGIVDGCRPVFFSNDDGKELEQFIFGDAGNKVEFGAHQCILVRDERAKELLEEKVGKVGLVMTIYESKGLEFNDVLLYNFFKDSVITDSAWRVVLNAIDDWRQVGQPEPAPAFNSIRHASVCSELKSLYVAITRARENVWIAEGSKKGRSSSRPMRTYWTSRGLVDNIAPGKEAPQLATSSKPEEWIAQGHELFHQQRYGQAWHCFTRANLPKWAAIAGAYYTRQKARLIPKTKEHLRKCRLAFTEAGQGFYDCSQSESDRTRLVYLKNSAACFEEGNSMERAAYVHRLAGNFTRSGELYRDLKMFDEALDVVKTSRDAMELKIVDSIIKRARIAYFDAREIDKGCRLFKSTDEVLEYLDQRDLGMARADILLLRGETVAAAEIHYADGRRDVAIPLFLQDPENTAAVQRGIECIVESLWSHCSFGRPSSFVQADPRVQDLLALVPPDLSKISPAHVKQLDMFRAISTYSRAALVGLSQGFLAEGDSASALHCLDHVFSTRVSLQSAPLTDVVQKLGVFLSYVELLSKAAFHPDAINDASIRRLFGVSRISENKVSAPISAFFLHRELLRLGHGYASEMSVVDFHVRFRQILSSRLRIIAAGMNEVCWSAPAFTPCHTYMFSGACLRVGCPDEHLLECDIPANYYAQRVRAHLQQILIFQCLCNNATFTLESDDQSLSPRLLVERLYNALYPPHHSMGTITDLDLSSIPEATEAMTVLRSWIRTLAFSQSFHPYTTFLRRIMRLSVLAFMFDREQVLAKNYLFQGQFCRTEEAPSRYLHYSYQVDSEHTSQNMCEDLLLSLAHQTGRGAFPLHYIVEKRLPINISVLCDYVDFLCSSFILCFCSRKGSFHNVTLPRSWLLKYFEIDAPYFNPTIRTNMFWHIPDCMTVLLEQLYTGVGAEYLIYGVNRNMANSPTVVRNLFIYRLVRAICLLGYNTSNDALRGKIRKAVARLGNFGRPHRLYSKFVYAANEDWMALAKATRRSLEDSSADDMIQLLERTRTSVTQAEGYLSGVCKIFYDRPDDIRLLLRRLAVTSTQTQPVPQTEQATEQAVQPARQISQPVVQEETVEESPDEPSDNDDQPTETLDVPEMTPPTAEEHIAALLIQDFYRRVMARRRGFAKDGIAGLKHHLYNACISVGVAPRSYRYIFLGPLISILTCIDYAKSECLALKNRTKKKLTNAESQEMEELDDLLTKTNQSGRALFELEKSLQPTAEIHLRHDVLELRKVVGRANEVLSDLPFELSPELSEELAIGVRGILTVWAYRPKRKPKPVVRLDEGGFEYYE